MDWGNVKLVLVEEIFLSGHQFSCASTTFPEIIFYSDSPDITYDDLHEFIAGRVGNRINNAILAIQYDYDFTAGKFLITVWFKRNFW